MKICRMSVVLIVVLFYASDAFCIDMRLPFEDGESWGISRGYGSVTHTGNDYWALDFNLLGSNDCGKSIVVIDEGLVQNVVHSTTGYGNYVDVYHGNGGFVSRYAHLQSTSVNVGDYIQRGDKIGKCGNTGNSSGCHLHFVLYNSFNMESVKPVPMGGYYNFLVGKK